jgi:hypothetical protein
MIPLLRSAVLTRAGFVHGFSTRIGGVSKPPFDSLDFALARDPEGLRENQARLAAALGVPATSLYQVTQVHGADVVVAEGDPAATVKREADALVAVPAGEPRAVAVRIADCVPLLVGDRDTGRVAAIHAGWRGVEAGVVSRALAALGASPSGLVAAIGPCIGACCFEVDRDVAARIARATVPDVVAREDGEKAYVDLRLGVRGQLRGAGLADASIDDVGGCTRCDREQFYSFRRDGEESGRLVGAVVPRG